ncbi:serine hydrolase domain-containing protein [Amycolatopsis sp. CA-230715]|uniref:serine hydrolase domain-containing protein n=1 Tax=Amycolatopsis sp. CA-230715 TaxID=2745196 RepID=UPI001C00A63C|nr:serine hydrolase domain-containing protein [Amycolatopsis sp. CA-230715]QWF85965.1 D-aminopeptidase [Amycolatopsis sp. CA-230715]
MPPETELTTDTLSELLTELTAEHRVPGAQLAVRLAGRTIEVVAGEETAGSGVPMTESSAVPLGSLTKPFTATLAMMLVDDGDVELDAPLTEYLPELRHPVTLRQVLSHSGGLASNVPELTDDGISRKRWIAEHCGARALVHEPGTVFSYSNIGYLLAGHLVETITGMTWSEAVGSVLLRPLGIEPSFVVGAPSARPAVDGHNVQLGLGRVRPVAAQTLPLVEEPTGALALSAADLLVFARAQLDGKLLGDDLAAETRRDAVARFEVGPFGIADGCGLGWTLYNEEGTTWCGHDGNAEGTSCHLRFDPADGTVIALATNANTGIALWEDLVTALRERGVGVANYLFSTLPDDPDPVPGEPGCAGTYVNNEEEFTIVAENDHFFLALDGERHSALTFFPGLRFTMRELDGGRMTYTGRFTRADGTGPIDGIQVIGRLARRTGRAP